MGGIWETRGRTADRSDRLDRSHAVPPPVHTRRDGCHVLGLRGELDLYTGPSVRTVITEIALREPTAQVVLDMSELTFLDSSGLRVLVAGLRQLRAGGGALRVAGGRGQVAEVLTITGLHQVLPIHPTADEAISAAAAQGDPGPTEPPPS